MQNNLIKILEEKLKFAKEQAKFTGSDNKTTITFKETSLYGKNTLNTRFVNAKQYFEIVQLYKLIITSGNVELEKIRKLIYSKPMKFSFLIKVDKHVNNMVETLYAKGPQYVALMYCNNRECERQFNHIGMLK